MFHRVDDPMQLGSSRYFQLAERLRFYDGAVRAALTAETTPVQVSTPTLGQPRQGGEQPVVLDDVRTVAAMTQANGFPGIEYIAG